MIHTYVATFYKERKVIKFSMNDADKFAFNQAYKSLTAFIKRLEIAPNIITINTESEFQKVELEQPHLLVDFERKYVHTLWDLYTEIGYDYKSKQFIDNTNTN